jgi:hypothetical protein
MSTGSRGDGTDKQEQGSSWERLAAAAAMRQLFLFSVPGSKTSSSSGLAGLSCVVVASIGALMCAAVAVKASGCEG